MGHDLKFLYEEARSLLKEQIDRHIERCGCLDEASDGPCPGVLASVAFLKATEKRAAKKEKTE